MFSRSPRSREIFRPACRRGSAVRTSRRARGRFSKNCAPCFCEELAARRRSGRDVDSVRALRGGVRNAQPALRVAGGESASARAGDQNIRRQPTRDRSPHSPPATARRRHAPGMLDRSVSVERHLAALRASGATAAQLDPVRAYRQLQSLRILVRDVLGLIDLAALHREHSALAEACLIFVHGLIAQETDLTIIALGKIWRARSELRRGSRRALRGREHARGAGNSGRDGKRHRGRLDRHARRAPAAGWREGSAHLLAGDLRRLLRKSRAALGNRRRSRGRA